MLLPRLLFLFLCASFPLSSSEPAAISTYLDLLHQYPTTLGPWGDWRQGEIEIIQDSNAIQDIQNQTGRTVGIIAQDKYWLWLNDAVQFPNGKTGVYGRLLWQQSLKGAPGVAVMCILPDQKIVLNCNYRHATRSWELELPRGCISSGESMFDAAKREVSEETGMQIDQLVLLGEMAIDTGMTNSVVPIFLAKVLHQGQASPEDSEAITDIVAFSLNDLYSGIKAGKIEMQVHGKLQEVKLRDPFLCYALLQMQIQGQGLQRPQGLQGH